jgi:hypothetical protein
VGNKGCGNGVYIGNIEPISPAGFFSGHRLRFSGGFFFYLNNFILPRMEVTKHALRVHLFYDWCPCRRVNLLKWVWERGWLGREGERDKGYFRDLCGKQIRIIHLRVLRV